MCKHFINTLSVISVFLLLPSFALSQPILYANCPISSKVQLDEFQSLEAIKNSCKIILESGWLEWSENIKDLTFHTDVEFDKLNIEQYEDIEDSVLMSCDIEASKCFPMKVLSVSDKNIDLPKKRNNFRNWNIKRHRIIRSLWDNSKNALIYRRLLLSADFQRRFGYDKGLFQRFLEHENLDSIELSLNRNGQIRDFANFDRHSKKSQQELYTQIKLLLKSKTIQPTESFSKDFYILDHWFDEIAMSPQLSVYSKNVTTTSAGYLLLASDPGNGLYVVFEDKTCIYIDSLNELHLFRGFLSGGRPILVYDSKTNQYWSRLPNTEFLDAHKAEFENFLKNTSYYEQILQYVDYSKIGFIQSNLFKYAWNVEKIQVESLNNDELYRVLIARERGSEERDVYKKEFLLSGVYNSLIDHVLLNTFLDGCTQLQCSSETARALFLSSFDKSEKFLKYNNFSTYSDFYLSSPFESWLSKDLTCTIGTQISLVFDFYESILKDTKYYCKQGYAKKFDGTTFHFWCWDESGDFVLENLSKMIGMSKAQTRSETFRNTSKTPLLCFEVKDQLINVVECEEKNYDELYNKSEVEQKPQPNWLFYIDN